MQKRVIAYHKAEGEVVSRNDPSGCASVFDRLPPLRDQRWIAIGRLDVDVAGLLLLTNDSEFANRLMHPSTGVEREYAVRLSVPLSPLHRQELLDGVMLADGMAKILAIHDGGEQGGGYWYRCRLLDSRFREAWRLFESQNYKVDRLVRIRFGSYAMPATLRTGNSIMLTDEEVVQLERLCLLPPRKHTGLYGRSRRLSERQERGQNREDRRDPRRNNQSSAYESHEDPNNAFDDDTHERAEDVDGNSVNYVERPRGGRGGYLRGRR